MHILVIPLSQSMSHDGLCYFVGADFTTEIHIGSLVEVPFGTKLLTGIVSEIVTEIPKYEIRAIVRVIASNPLISTVTLNLVTTLAKSYYLPIHKALAIVLGRGLLWFLEKKGFVIQKEPPPTPIQTPKREIHIFQDRRFSPKDLGEYIKQKCVVIFPDDIMLSIFVDYWKEKIEFQSLFTWDTPTKKHKIWQQLHEWRFVRIFWTRQLLGYTLDYADEILYLEDAFGREYFQYPIHIPYLTLLRILADQSDRHLRVITSTPSVNLLSGFRDFSLTHIQWK